MDNEFNVDNCNDDFCCRDYSKILFYFLYSIVILSILASIICLCFSLYIEPSFINSYTNLQQLYVTDESIAFNSNRIIVGDAITHEDNATQFIINESGHYKITYNATVFNVIYNIYGVKMVLKKDNDEIIGSEGFSQPSNYGISDPRNTVSSTVIINVDTTSTIELVNKTNQSVYELCSITIEKLD